MWETNSSKLPRELVLIMLGFTREDLTKIEQMIDYKCKVEILPSTQSEFLVVRVTFIEKDLKYQFSYQVYQHPFVDERKTTFICNFAASARKTYEEYGG